MVFFSCNGSDSIDSPSESPPEELNQMKEDNSAILKGKITSFLNIIIPSAIAGENVSHLTCSSRCDSANCVELYSLRKGTETLLCRTNFLNGEYAFSIENLKDSNEVVAIKTKLGNEVRESTVVINKGGNHKNVDRDETLRSLLLRNKIKASELLEDTSNAQKILEEWSISRVVKFFIENNILYDENSKSGFLDLSQLLSIDNLAIRSLLDEKILKLESELPSVFEKSEFDEATLTQLKDDITSNLDSDKDGVLDNLDCAPRDRERMIEIFSYIKIPEKDCGLVKEKRCISESERSLFSVNECSDRDLKTPCIRGKEVYKHGEEYSYNLYPQFFVNSGQTCQPITMTRICNNGHFDDSFGLNGNVEVKNAGSFSSVVKVGSYFESSNFLYSQCFELNQGARVLKTQKKFEGENGFDFEVDLYGVWNTLGRKFLGIVSGGKIVNISGSSADLSRYDVLTYAQDQAQARYSYDYSAYPYLAYSSQYEIPTIIPILDREGMSFSRDLLGIKSLGGKSLENLATSYMCADGDESCFGGIFSLPLYQQYMQSFSSSPDILFISSFYSSGLKNSNLYSINKFSGKKVTYSVRNFFDADYTHMLGRRPVAMAPVLDGEAGAASDHAAVFYYTKEAGLYKVLYGNDRLDVIKEFEYTGEPFYYNATADEFIMYTKSGGEINIYKHNRFNSSTLKNNFQFNISGSLKYHVDKAGNILVTSDYHFGSSTYVFYSAAQNKFKRGIYLMPGNDTWIVQSDSFSGGKIVLSKRIDKPRECKSNEIRILNLEEMGIESTFSLEELNNSIGDKLSCYNINYSSGRLYVGASVGGAMIYYDY